MLEKIGTFGIGILRKRLMRTLKGVHDGFVGCVRWAPGFMEGLEEGTSPEVNGMAKVSRCNVATGCGVFLSSTAQEQKIVHSGF